MKNLNRLSDVYLAGALAGTLMACDPEVGKELEQVSCSIKAVAPEDGDYPYNQGEAMVSVHTEPASEFSEGGHDLSVGEIFTVEVDVFTGCGDHYDACLEGVESLKLGQEAEKPHVTCKDEMFFPVSSTDGGTYQSYDQDWLYADRTTYMEGTSAVHLSDTMTVLSIHREIELQDGKTIPASMQYNSVFEWPHTDGQLETQDWLRGGGHGVEDLHFTRNDDAAKAAWQNISGFISQIY